MESEQMCFAGGYGQFTLDNDDDGAAGDGKVKTVEVQLSIEDRFTDCE